MNCRILNNFISVALLIIGSAILLISCEQGVDNDEQDTKSLMTQQSDTLTIISSENGMKGYRFYAPLMERYEFATEPYMEFRRGVKIETYQDSTQIIESTLIADYAIFLETQKLWEAKGNVVATNAKGEILETQQLFWNQKTKKIYSNVDSKVTQGSDVIIGVGFESDEEFDDFIFRKPKGKVLVNMEPTDSLSQQQDTTVVPTYTPSSQATGRPQNATNALPDRNNQNFVGKKPSTPVTKPRPQSSSPINKK